MIDQHAEGVAHLGGEFAGMVHMDTHPERMMFFQDRAELRGDALREKDRDAGADTNELDVRDGTQAPKQSVELFIGEEERIAAGEEDIAHLRVPLEVGNRLVKVGLELLLPSTAHHARAGAVATVGGAAIGNQKQHPVGIAVNQPWHRHMAVLTARVGHLGGGNRSLPDMGDDLPADRAVGILALDQIEIMGRDGEGQLVARKDHASTLLRSEEEVLLKPLQCGDPVAKLPLPVIPLVGWNLLPVTGAGGAEVRLDAVNGGLCFHG